MIVQWLLARLGDFLVWVVSIVPAPTLPSSVRDFQSQLDGVASGMQVVGPLLPLGLLRVCIPLALGIYVYTISVRIIRWVQSTFTGGGGVT